MDSCAKFACDGIPFCSVIKARFVASTRPARQRLDSFLAARAPAAVYPRRLRRGGRVVAGHDWRTRACTDRVFSGPSLLHWAGSRPREDGGRPHAHAHVGGLVTTSSYYGWTDESEKAWVLAGCVSTTHGSPEPGRLLVGGTDRYDADVVGHWIARTCTETTKPLKKSDFFFCPFQFGCIVSSQLSSHGFLLFSISSCTYWWLPILWCATHSKYNMNGYEWL